MKIAFLILHYKNIEDTKKCISSIKKIQNTCCSDIIVVDNGSGDGSGNNLISLYEKDEQIQILLSEKNLGFSGGNNLGYQFIRTNLKVDFIVVCNNDVVFNQKNFIDKIYEIYDEEYFHVLGPDIFIPGNNEHQSPIFLKPMTVNELSADKNIYERYIDHPRLFVYRRKLQLLKNRFCTNNVIFRKLYNNVKGKENIDYKQRYENVGLQGSCLIVSQNYILCEEKMFSPEPFLYCEEYFLYFKCKMKGYKIVYRPDIGICHEECGSIRNSNKSAVKQMEFVLPHHVKAREQLIEYIVKNNLESR